MSIRRITKRLRNIKFKSKSCRKTAAKEIPFAVTLPNAPSVLNADLMKSEEIHIKLQEGYDDLRAGRVQDAALAFQKFRESNEVVTQLFM